MLFDMFLFNYNFTLNFIIFIFSIINCSSSSRPRKESRSSSSSSGGSNEPIRGSGTFSPISPMTPRSPISHDMNNLMNKNNTKNNEKKSDFPVATTRKCEDKKSISYVIVPHKSLRITESRENSALQLEKMLSAEKPDKVCENARREPVERTHFDNE